MVAEVDDVESEPCPNCEKNESGLFTRRARAHDTEYRCERCDHRWTSSDRGRSR